MIPLIGLSKFHYVRAQFEEGWRLLDRLCRLVEPLGDPALLLSTHIEIGGYLFQLGRLREARGRLTNCYEIYRGDSAAHHEGMIRHFGLDSAAVVGACLAYMDAIEGWPQRAESGLDAAFTYAQSHPFTRAVVLAYAATIPLLWDDAQRVQVAAQELVSLSEEHGSPARRRSAVSFSGGHARSRENRTPVWR